MSKLNKKICNVCQTKYTLSYKTIAKVSHAICKSDDDTDAIIIRDGISILYFCGKCAKEALLKHRLTSL